jgi:anti-sigma factor RsiW
VNVTREIVIDLLPAYAGGEASADTRAAVEAFAASDPQIRSMVRTLASETAGDLREDALPPGLEKEIVERTRRMIARRSWTLALAVFFTLLPLTFVFRDGGVTFFMLRDEPQSAWLWASAALLWVHYWRLGARLSVPAQPSRKTPSAA